MQLVEKICQASYVNLHPVAGQLGHNKHHARPHDMVRSSVTQDTYTKYDAIMRQTKRNTANKTMLLVREIVYREIPTLNTESPRDVKFVIRLQKQRDHVTIGNAKKRKTKQTKTPTRLMATNPACLEADEHPLDDESRQLRESGVDLKPMSIPWPTKAVGGVKAV